MRAGLRTKLLVGLGVTAVVGALALSRGDGAAQGTFMTLTLTPAVLTPPGTTTARVTIQPGVPTDDTVRLFVVLDGAQVGAPVLMGGSWTAGACSAGPPGLPSISCPFTGAVYPLTLDFVITVPAGAAPGNRAVITNLLSATAGAGDNRLLTILAPTTTEPTTTTTTTTTEPTTTTNATTTPTTPTTTAAVTPTSVTPPTSGAVLPTSAAATTDPGTLPATGTSGFAPFAAIVVVAGGAFLVLLARRPGPLQE